LSSPEGKLSGKVCLNLLISVPRASGLGRACVEDICAKGGYVAILDMNEELAQEVVNEIGGGKTKFFEANVLETESIAAAVKGALAWSKQTGKEIGGVIAAAGVSTPAKVSSVFLII
jgi:3-hydroxyacyl-CoA dehydrogenase/3-hydroxy-2-methylbutyryl-CoA dehydrogenase